MTKSDIINKLCSIHSDKIMEKRALIRKLMNNHIMARAPIFFPKIFRARPVLYPGLFTHLDQLWSPPPEKVKTYGRANGPGKPVFYAAENPHTALIETTPNCQVSVYLELELKEITSKPFHFVVGPYEKFKKKGINLERSNDPDVETFLVDEFRKQQTVKGRSPYQYSSLISELFFRYTELDGLIYPSVPFGFKWLNFAFKPESVSKLYIPKKVTVVLGWNNRWVKIGTGVIANKNNIEYQADDCAIENIPAISKSNINKLNALFYK